MGLPSLPYVYQGRLILHPILKPIKGMIRGKSGGEREREREMWVLA